jgi:hypothetical protein
VVNLLRRRMDPLAKINIGKKGKRKMMKETGEIEKMKRHFFCV